MPANSFALDELIAQINQKLPLGVSIDRATPPQDIIGIANDLGFEYDEFEDSIDGDRPKYIVFDNSPFADQLCMLHQALCKKYGDDSFTYPPGQSYGMRSNARNLLRQAANTLYRLAELREAIAMSKGEGWDKDAEDFFPYEPDKEQDYQNAIDDKYEAVKDDQADYYSFSLREMAENIDHIIQQPIELIAFAHTYCLIERGRNKQVNQEQIEDLSDEQK